jgi:hypothetical protein
MSSELTKAIAERNRYRDLLYRRVIDDEIARTITKCGGRSKVLAIVVEPQLSVREIGNKFQVFVIDPVTGVERPGLSLSDLMTDMRSSAEFAGAFDSRPQGTVRLANNPFDPETENLTQQALLLRRNPGMAARMRQEAKKNAERCP